MLNPILDEGGPEEARRDEALGRQLEQYLDSLRPGAPLRGPAEAPSPVAPSAGTDFEGLRPVVESLSGLCDYLEASAPAEGEPDATRDASGTGDPEEFPGRNPEPAPQLVGKYEVIRPLGQGGQASALLAFDPDLRRHVVVKRYHAARSSLEQEAILKEGQALARVKSPYVAQCYSAERAEGDPFLVVEYVPGKSLAEAWRERPCDLDRALRLVGCLAEGLSAVHTCGLLHRDIKPANVVLGDDGLPRLVDFGLTSPLAGEDLRRILGTLPYMAPEQARGECERIDVRSDIYGLGAVLYELLTGRPPHRGHDRAALWHEVREGKVVSPAQRTPQVPAVVSELCLRCLAADPAQRFASASELAEAVHRLERQRRRPWWRAPRTVLLAVAVAALFSVFAWRNWHAPAEDAKEELLPAGTGTPPVAEGQEFAVSVVAVGTARPGRAAAAHARQRRGLRGDRRTHGLPRPLVRG
jgi:hypothetical protein